MEGAQAKDTESTLHHFLHFLIISNLATSVGKVSFTHETDD